MPVQPFVLVLLVALAACGDRDGAPGTNIAIDARSETGTDVAIAADGTTGKVAVKLPGFDANVRLPKMLLDSTNFEIDGVKLYPGSKVTTVNVDADKSAGNEQALVKIGFTAPADPATVRDWFSKAFAAKSVTVTSAGSGLRGTSDDGNAFTMAFAPGTAGQTVGTVEIVDGK